jgi:phospholipid/cholesterol/gamma-HCH transport system permease protein
MSPVELVRTVGHLSRFAFQALTGLPSALLRPRQALVQFYHVLLGALPLGVTAGLAIGAVVWLHLRGSLVQVGGPGAVRYLPQGLALAVVLEFAPLAAGLIVAGRTGAGLAAELGAMRLTEQIDALEVLGRSPLRELVAPRVLACMVSLPLLTVFVIYLALGAGYLCEALGGSLTLTAWILACRDVLTPILWTDVVPSLLKTVVFGFLIGVSGCHFGLVAHGGTEGVGRAATAGVVASIFLVLVSDVVLVRLIKVLTL